MAAVEMKDKKKEMIEKTAQEFQKLNGDNQMFILGYMLGIQQERQRTTPQPQTAQEVAGMEVQGTFNAQRFFDTLAMIISQREGVKVTVTVKQPEPEEKEQRSAQALGEKSKGFSIVKM